MPVSEHYRRRWRRRKWGPVPIGVATALPTATQKEAFGHVGGANSSTMNRSQGPAAVPHVEGYSVAEQIDSGGFSRVFRAVQHGLEREVAIKVLNASFEDERQKRTFERECRLMGQLSTHQNIVTVFASAVTSDGQPCIIMELYRGTYRADEQLEIAEVVDVGAKVADALQTIHDQGIVHRDIKPHNIFVSTHGQPAIGDFGISSIETERTVTGGAGFSINYAPPEVFEEGGAGLAGDIYSLGATLYQLAAGEVPFPHTGDPTEKTRATVHKIISAPPPTLRRDDAPPELDRLLRRCMAKSAADRPATAAEVALELRRMQRIVGAPKPRRPEHQPATGPRSQPADESDQTIDRRSSRPDNIPSGNLTVVRDREQPRPVPTPGEELEAPPPPSRRRLLIGAGVGLTVVLASAGAIAFGSLGGSETAATTTSVSSPSTAAAFAVLLPPAELEVVRTEEGVYDISWASDQSDVAYQIQLVGESESRFADTTSYSWTFDEDPGTACFEVRTVNEARTRLSQSAAGPACATG